MQDHDLNTMTRHNRDAQKKLRAEKRAAALRENLKRRKTQQQERSLHDSERQTDGQSKG